MDSSSEIQRLSSLQLSSNDSNEHQQHEGQVSQGPQGPQGRIIPPLSLRDLEGNDEGEESPFKTMKIGNSERLSTILQRRHSKVLNQFFNKK